MSTTGIRPGFRSLTPYIQVAEARKFIEFVKQAFLAEELACHEHDGHVMHAELQIGDSIMEVSEPHGSYPGLAVALHYYVADVDAVYARAVAAGATAVGPPTDHEYGERGASLLDPFGNYWYVATWLS